MTVFTTEKYCVLPGIEPLRLSSTSGHVVILGEEPRVIPVEFESEALSKGARTETQIAELRAKFVGGESGTSVPPAAATTAAAAAGAKSGEASGADAAKAAESGAENKENILDPAKLSASAAKSDTKK